MESYLNHSRSSSCIENGVKGTLENKRNRRFLMFCSAVMATFVWATAVYGKNVVISEVFYHPTGTNLSEQWFEIYNTNKSAVDLSGWSVGGDVSFCFESNTVIGAKQYLVVAADRATFASNHIGITQFVAGWTGVLKHDIKLMDAGGTVVNNLSFYSEGDWATRVMGEVQFNHQGWEWSAAHNGEGKSLELVNANLPNEYALNWTSSLVDGGTPGRENSVASTNAAPIILDVTHRPLVPQPADPVTVSARVVDEDTNGLLVTLYWRVDGTTNFNASQMLDDGSHGDGVAADGIFAAIVPAHAHGTIVEFYIDAEDLEGNRRVYPSFIQPTNSTRTANLLFQVDTDVYSGAQPLYRIIMSEAERAELYNLGRAFPDADSDAGMNATWLSSDSISTAGSTLQCRYNCTIRNRGHGTRITYPNNYHVDIPEDRKWKNSVGINLNSHYGYSQILGSAVFRQLSIPMPDSQPSQVRVNSTNLMKTITTTSFGFYAANEQYNNDFVKRSFALDPDGNSYRGIRGPTQEGTSPEANLEWHGTNFFIPDAYTNAYFKQNNFLQNDYADLIQLMGVLNLQPGYASSNDYVAKVRSVLNVDEWMRYMAVNTLLDNDETCLANGVGDDYALYRGMKDTRFWVLPYDLDTLMGRGATESIAGHGIWRMTNVSVMDRFMKTPEFAANYLRQLRDLAKGYFASEHMDVVIEQTLGEQVPQNTLDYFKKYNSNQIAHVLSLIPSSLVVSNDLAKVDGLPHTTNSVISLSGGADATVTCQIWVNGSNSVYTAWLGAWTNSNVRLNPGVNRIRVQAIDFDGNEIAQTNVDVWYDDGSVAGISSSITTNTTWRAEGGPYLVSSSVTVGSGATLSIEAGTTVYLGSGVNLTVASGGTLIAEGTADAPIWFSASPGATANWGHIVVNGTVGSPETRISHAHFESNGSTCIQVTAGTVFLDHLTFGNTKASYVHVDGASFLIQNCVFPTPTTEFELVHGTGGIKSGGRGIFLRNYFGTPTGYNDVVDFTGGNRPNQPIVQFFDNVFAGATDDILDLDGTDAWIQGNIFLHTHKNGAPDSSSAVSGGDDSGKTSEITIIGNIMYDCDQAATAKQGNFFTLINNTIVHQTHVGGDDVDGAVVNLADDGTTEGVGYYLEGNIIDDAEKLVRNQTSGVVTFTNNLMSLPWSGPGGNNTQASPLFYYVPELNETYFSNWADAQVLKQWFRLQPGSPALGTGPNGVDKGALIPYGVSISGEPTDTNSDGTALLYIGKNCSGNGIPVSGFSNGSGYVSYKWRLDTNSWSDEIPISTPITLSGLSDGLHHVEVIGKNDANLYQNDSQLDMDAIVTTSRVWTVDSKYVPPVANPSVQINEILAQNDTVLTNQSSTPDLIELHNTGTNALDLSGMGLTDDLSVPYKFVFPSGTTIAPEGYFVLCADDASRDTLLHTGFALAQSGETLALFDRVSDGGALLDSVSFGLQISDFSIGRRTDGTWGLCQPTFGSANIAIDTGNQERLKINEWLSDAQFVAKHDFIELYNPDTKPVALGGLYLSDASGAPDKDQIFPLSFIAGKGFVTFIADGQESGGANHLNFKLSADTGLILLSTADLSMIDAVTYTSQTTDVSEGRSPNGADTLTAFAEPTPGAGNPGASSDDVSVSTLTVSLIPMTASWRYNQTTNLDGVDWQTSDYDDSAWPSGAALLAVENCGCLPAPNIQTSLKLGRMTYYFRTDFVVNTNLDGFFLNITTILDDGAIVYLNGVQILTNRMSSGTATYSTTASTSVGDATSEYFTVPGDSLVQGTNILAVEVHQYASTSSDVVWGMSMDASRTVTNAIGGSVIPVVLNEILASNKSLTNFNGRTSDYVELYNTATNAIDLGGASLTDDPQFGRKWVFSEGTTIASGGYLVVFCDAKSSSSATNTGFALNAHGGAVYLFDRPESGGNLVDALTYGIQTADFSIGRIPDGTGNWVLNTPSSGARNASAALGSVAALCVNEWMADPLSGSDWFELYNCDDKPVSLSGIYLTDDFTKPTQFTIAPLSFIAGHGFMKWIADGDAGAGNDHVNFSLKKSGEAIGVFSQVGSLIDGITFDAQESGVSQGRFPDGTTNVVLFTSTPSPAESNYLPLENVVINEVLPLGTAPLEQAIELANLEDSSVDISGWYLSDNTGNLKKFRVPDGTLLNGGGYFVFYENAFDSTNAVAFTLDGVHGGSVILSQADAGGQLTGYRNEVAFGAAEEGVSFGRYETSDEIDFTALSSRSFGVDNPSTVENFRTGLGQKNSGPSVGPIVISEIMYHPLSNSVENLNEEYLELHNITTNAVAFWSSIDATLTWHIRDGVDFEFPTNVILMPDSRLLVVGFTPDDPILLTAFRRKYGVSDDIPVYGPWTGHLANKGDNVELTKPGMLDPVTGEAADVMVDRVNYLSDMPWPVIPANETNSIHRLEENAYGNDPVNWFVSAPSAGNSDNTVDSDGDGMPDSWEMKWFGTLQRDGSEDYDEDGISDREEFLSGTNPTDPTDYLRIESISIEKNLVLRFKAVAGKKYTCQYSDSLENGTWKTLVDVPTQSTTGVITITDDTTLTKQRFYRLVIPIQ